MSKVKAINGKHIINSKKRLLFSILPDDVQKGKGKQPDSCAAAIACVRQFGAISARVHVSRTYLEFDKHWVRFATPASLRTEIVSFDRGNKFEPGAYELVPVYPSAQANGKRQGGNGHDGASKPKRKRATPHVLNNVRSSAVNSY